MNPFENPWLVTLATVNFLHVAIVLFLISTAMLVFVSLATEAPRRWDLINITWSDTPRLKTVPTTMRRINIAASSVLVALVLGLWWYFR
jgi:SSS family solute:Na+ symporter